MNEILRGVVNKSLAQSGYQFLPGGLLLQWGVVNAPAPTTTGFNFPIPFPNGAFSLQASVGTPVVSGNWQIGASLVSNSVFQIQNTNVLNHGVYWFAIGC